MMSDRADPSSDTCVGYVRDGVLSCIGIQTIEATILADSHTETKIVQWSMALQITPLNTSSCSMKFGASTLEISYMVRGR